MPLSVILTAMLAVAPAEAPRPLWVFLADRPHDARAAEIDPRDTLLTDRALARRAMRRADGRLVDEHDLAVDEAAIAAVRATGARVRTTSRWLNAISVEASPAQVASLRALACVRATQPVRAARVDRPEEASSGDSIDRPAGRLTEAGRRGNDRRGDGAGDEGGIASLEPYGAAKPQLDQMDLVSLHARGFTGQGMVIGVLDSGFHRKHVAFNDPSHPLVVLAEYDFINDDPNTDIEDGDPAGQHKHGTWILGTMGAYQPGQFLGAAYDASFVLAKTEDTTSETPIEEDYYVAGLEFIEANGADVATSSLGYFDWYTPDDFDGLTAVTTIAVNMATANGLACVTAAGNGGHDNDPATNHLGAPADAFQVVTCGAVAGDGTIAGFSSDGPSADGRIKPEVLAWGVQTATIRSTTDTGYTTVSGTSLSTPLVAGAIACILEARPEFDVTALRTALFTTSTDFLFAGSADPLFIRGYGIVQANLASLKTFAPADLNHDGAVDGSDLGLILGAWGPCSGCPADLDGDGKVGGGDLGALLAAWGG
ncbi:MAG: S8 family serine peptidase [Phycisphaerales bacterium]